VEQDAGGPVVDCKGWQAIRGAAIVGPMERKVALVTGASRGIGHAIALALAEHGFDVAVAARTLREGEGVARSSSFREPKQVAVAGSVESTAAAVRTRGRDALALRLDLLDRASIDAAVAETLRAWHRIDLLVNNGIYQGPGVMDRFLDVPLEAVERIFQGNVFAQIHLLQQVLRQMLSQGGGTIVDITSTSGYADPPGPVGRGGWGFAYGASKGAFHRVAGVLHAEHAGDGIRVFNVDPGYTPTDTMRALRGQGTDLDRAYGGAPPAVTAAVVAWLATDPGAEEWRGKCVQAQRLCRDRALVPGWPPPRPS
jgi:NAD(P)-dependent dehydrogenase (short-subunit alcohol dehydrogenase family)